MISIKSIAAFLVFIALLYGAGILFHWSWAVKGFLLFDVVLHFLGGAFVGLVFLYLNDRWNVIPRFGAKNYLAVFGGLLASVALAGVLWEFAEWVLYYGLKIVFKYKNVPLREQASWYFDTLNDLFNGLLGGLVLFLIFYKRRLRFYSFGGEKIEKNKGVV